MTYEREKAKAYDAAVREELVRLWLKCSSYDEFDLKASVEIPDASRTDRLACRLHWFRKAKPAAYFLAWLSATVAVEVVCGCLGCLTPGGFALGVVYGGIVNLVASLAYNMRFGELMRTLDIREREISVGY